MKSVLISIRPKWCTKIASGEKTIEVRKSHPKLETPFKCYIYRCLEKHGDIYTTSGKVIGEFVCDDIYWAVSTPKIFNRYPCYHKKAIEDACMTMEEAEKYSGRKPLYGWHISDLQIYDEPKELREFNLSRAPMSWCYCEESEGK